MSMPRMADAQAHLRRLAVSRVNEGGRQVAVARFLGVSDRSVRRWVAAHRAGGDGVLSGKPHPGRPPKLTDEHAAVIASWAGRRPCDFGFPTDRWTAPRLAQLIEARLGVRVNHRYLNDWLRRHAGVTPQMPTRAPRERDEAAIEWWVRREWPRIKKRRGRPAPTWFSPTRRAS